MPVSHDFFATCPRYVEELLAAELEQLGMDHVGVGLGGVSFSASLSQAYRACLWSRLASRILLIAATVRVNSTEDVYAAAGSIAWREHLPQRKPSLTVDFTGTSAFIRNTHYGAQVVKDAVVDQWADEGERPEVDRQNPAIRINAHLAKGRLQLAIDLSGESLHRRGYRKPGAAAPLKENLAAALLTRAGWPKSSALFDPLCGTGTLVLEAAMMACDIAPGLYRNNWGFNAWQQHDAQAWASIKADAKKRAEQGIEEALENKLSLLGCDKDTQALHQARASATALGVAEFVRFEVESLSKTSRAGEQQFEGALGLLICNPPYGERLGDERELNGLYSTIGTLCRNQFGGWRAAVVSSSAELLESVALRADKRYRFRNGPLDCQLRTYAISVNAVAPQEELAEVAEALANRLRKNRKRLKSQLKKLDTNCYRLYDADLPEYASIVDVYNEYAVVIEYAAPDTIDARKARRRSRETLATVAEVLDLPADRVVYKRKERQRGQTQYQREGEGSALYQVQESHASLLVNLHDYHDTGLFLDHRGVRRVLANEARGKRFLNLFCYTAAATAQVGLAGASKSTSVDMSRSYIRWAKKNLDLNGLSSHSHELIQADCLQWLEQCEQQYDLILLDPPSFSNSKRMESVLDIQRDHAELIHTVMERLSPTGSLYFSNNRRRFSLDQSVGDNYLVKEISDQTRDPDVKSGSAHRCWRVQHKEG